MRKKKIFEIAGYDPSASTTGGDCWGYFETDRYLALYIADVTGHGPSSAVLTAQLRFEFSKIQKELTQKPECELRATDLLAQAHQAVFESARGKLNMTLFAGVYSIQQQKFEYANAGHPSAWIIRKKNTSLEVLRSRGPRLGEKKSYDLPQTHTIDLQTGDMIFLFSDGVIDCTNSEGQPYGKKHLRELIEAQSKKNASVKKACAYLNKDLSHYIDKNAHQDDLTFAFFKAK